VVLLLIRPTELFEADWQLSFASVLGILMFCPLFFPLLREKTIDHPWFTDFVKSRPFLPRIIERPEPYSMFSTSFTAWLSAAGIMLYHFHTIQLLTSVWTVLASPLIGLVSFLGYLKLIIALFLPSVAAAMGTIVGRLADLTIWIVKLFADLDISGILIGKTNGAAVLLFYGLIVFVFFSRLRNPTLKKVICTATAVVIIAMLAMPKWQRANSDNLVVTTLDVGHGQAILAELPGRANILFDAGSLSRSDIGTRVIAPFLQYSGIGKLDAIVISHGDIDHINGLLEILDDYPAKIIYSHDIFFNDQQNRPTVEFLRKELFKKDVEIRPVNDINQVASTATVKVLWPSREIYEDNEINPNDRSAVTMIEYAGKRILICSDIEKFAQKEILRLYPDLKADVLIAPHHGSAKTLEPSFMDKIGPNIIISSCSESSYKKGQVIRLQKDPNYYTGRDGAITVRVGVDGTVETDAFKIKK
jgi:competence protein ComEC